MIGLRRACAFVAVSLLTSTATADAECAWVRWVDFDGRWTIMAGFKTLESCDAAIETAIALRRLPPQEVVRELGFSSYVMPS
jgi:hypothetical protein